MEVLIPVVFEYWLGSEFQVLDKRNHAALIVLNIVDKKWTQFSFYDSQDDNRYFQKASASVVMDFFSARLLRNVDRADNCSNRSWIVKEPIYHSL